MYNTSLFNHTIFVLTYKLEYCLPDNNIPGSSCIALDELSSLFGSLASPTIEPYWNNFKELEFDILHTRTTRTKERYRDIILSGLSHHLVEKYLD